MQGQRMEYNPSLYPSKSRKEHLYYNMRKEKYIKQKRYKSSYYFTVQIFKDGKSYSKTFNSKNYSTPGEALNAACKHRDEKLDEFNKRGIPGYKTTVGECFKNYFKIFSTPVKTRKNYESLFRNYISDPFGKRDIYSITTLDIQQCLNTMIYDCSNDTINRVFTTWKKIYKVAILQQAVTLNPCEAVVVPSSKRVKKRKQQSCSDETVDMICDDLINQEGDEAYRYDNRMYVYLIRIMQYSGARPAEVIALHKDDIDFKHHTVHINRAYGTDEDGASITPCKTESSVRDIPMSTSLEFILRALLEETTSKYPLQLSDGSFIDITKLSSKIHYIAERLNVDFHLYMLRHNFASALVSGGADIRSIMELMGHSGRTGAMTLDYARSNDERKEKAVQLVEKSRKTADNGLTMQS